MLFFIWVFFSFSLVGFIWLFGLGLSGFCCVGICVGLVDLLVLGLMYLFVACILD